jgi:hypothetical protein
VATVKNHGGEVIAIRPNYLQAIFGIPDPVEDDSARAIRAALEICALAEQQAGGAELTVTSGEIAVASLSAQSPRREEGDQGKTPLSLSHALYLGTVFGEAEKLLRHSQRNRVLVNQRARRLADGDFVFVSHTAKDEPDSLSDDPRYSDYPDAPYYEVSAFVDDHDVPFRGDHTERQDNEQIIGRERELAVLSGHWQKVMQGGGHVVGIAGEAGVGKSRLLAEYRRTVTSMEHLWIGLACSSTGRDTPYWLLSKLLRRIFDIAPSDKEAIVEAKIAQRLGE